MFDHNKLQQNILQKRKITAGPDKFLLKDNFIVTSHDDGHRYIGYSNDIE